MGLHKCPRCELNYVKDGQTYCDVCKRDMARDNKVEEMPDLCVECNENVAVPGSDYCVLCLREKRKLESMSEVTSEDILQKVVNNDASEIDSLEIEIDTDIPEGELKEIDQELCSDLDELDSDDSREESFESLAEREARDDDEEEELD